jgi:hypothetical protein
MSSWPKWDIPSDTSKINGGGFHGEAFHFFRWMYFECIYPDSTLSFEELQLAMLNVALSDEHELECKIAILNFILYQLYSFDEDFLEIVVPICSEVLYTSSNYYDWLKEAFPEVVQSYVDRGYDVPLSVQAMKHWNPGQS